MELVGACLGCSSEAGIVSVETIGKIYIQIICYVSIKTCLHDRRAFCQIVLMHCALRQLKNGVCPCTFVIEIFVQIFFAKILKIKYIVFFPVTDTRESRALFGKKSLNMTDEWTDGRPVLRSVHFCMAYSHLYF